MRSHSEHSNGRREIVGLIDKLRVTHKKVVSDEMRIWLIRQLTDRGLTTRDIYSFVYKQAKLRSFYRILDKQTMKSAIHAKLKDLRFTMKSKCKTKKHQEKCLLKLLGGRSYSLRRVIKKIKADTRKERDLLKTKYVKKIAHYESKQIRSGGRVDRDQNSNIISGTVPTVTPRYLDEYSTLSIFGILFSLFPCHRTAFLRWYNRQTDFHPKLRIIRGRPEMMSSGLTK